MAAKQAAEKLISEHLIAVFSKSYCPYCSQAKSVIDKLGLEKGKVGILELDTMGSEGSDIQVCIPFSITVLRKTNTDVCFDSIFWMWIGVLDGENQSENRT